MNRFTIADTALDGLKTVQHRRREDPRGFLSRLFCAEELRKAGWDGPIAQINHTQTSYKGTVRGMHYQLPPHAEVKLITCIRGEVWDVAVDIRSGSPTFLQWHAVRLSAANGKAMLVPEGFAHGFQSLTDDAELLYCHSTAYAAHAEAGLNPTDPVLQIDWPLAISQISARDSQHPGLKPTFAGIRP